MNWTKGDKLTEIEILNLSAENVVYVELGVDPVQWRIGDIATLDRMNAFGDHWDVYNVSVHPASMDAVLRGVREKIRGAAWTDEMLIKYYGSVENGLRVLSEYPEGYSPADKKISDDYGEFS